MKPIILIVEDNETEQYVLKQLIHKFDYDSHVVSSGEQAITAMGLSSYAAVIMDITLPGIDGFECTRRIRRLELPLGRRTPIIAITARVSQSDRNDSIGAGVDDYMTKPFDPEELRKVLLRYVYDPQQPNLKTLSPLPPEELDDVFEDDSGQYRALEDRAEA